ncbi:phosphatidate cytidylyltransferase [Raineyella antarctica]|uniref:Phosphatidate cytidylyltransferase n=1 Tax=Raineyella antarctica TaxID=1577474 RepID=A0A1G6HAA3_9ACTN|nr:phosphatidate cytidylyltransferase [Raineyella antarctica]SDB91083.1 phosphatidate cytidylyltransferase [Raineyella antarctica]
MSDTESTTGSPRPGPTAPKSGRAGRNLPAAILVGVILATLFLSSLLWWMPGFVILTTTLIGMAAVEVHQALKRVEMTSAILVIEAGLVAMMGGGYIMTRRAPEYSSTFLVVCLGLMVLASFLVRLPKGAKGFVKDTAASMLTIAYLPLMGAFASLLVAETDGAGRAILWLGTVVCSDTGGYIAGVLFGRHQMAPTISPKKTWEGFAGSLLLGAAFAAVVGVLVLGTPWWTGALVGIALVIAAIAGDLVESLIKRDLGVKDMGSFLPGHGGVTDRIDAMVLSAPVAWILMHFLIPGA